MVRVQSAAPLHNFTVDFISFFSLSPAPVEPRPMPAAELPPIADTAEVQQTIRPLSSILKAAHSVETSGKLVLPPGPWPRAEIAPHAAPLMLTAAGLARPMAR